MRIATLNKIKHYKTFTISLILLITTSNCLNLPTHQLKTSTPTQSFETTFNAHRAFEDLTNLMAYGSRIPNSEAHRDAIRYITMELEASGWKTNLQQLTYLGKPVKNIIGHFGVGDKWIMLGAHYDSRIYADKDPIISNQKSPVPGANDGASGVAILLELSRVVPAIISKDTKISLIFFDAEDNGDIENWEWILGSSAYVSSLDTKPDAVIILDMVGDKDLQLYQERNSNKQLTDEIWSIAAKLRHSDIFIPQVKYNMLDDHIPFIRAGIPAVDIIDFDYPYWHTTSDTIDKVSIVSLQIVGDTIVGWLSVNNPISGR